MPKSERNLPLLLLWLMSVALPRSSAAQSMKVNEATAVTRSTGVVVERVAEFSKSREAGLESGDVLLDWVQGESRGDINSPFDITLLEIGRGPRGPVLLEGLHGSTLHNWTLTPGQWGLETKPNFPPAIGAAYDRGLRTLHAGSAEQAVEQWRSLSHEVGETDGVWLLLRSAGALVKNRLWKEADTTYGEALQQSATAKAETRLQIHRHWAEAFELRSDWPRADDHCQEALRQAQSLGDQPLLLADILDGLGTIAWRRSKSSDSQKYYEQALEVQMKLAPNSLSVARSLAGLGTVAWSTGNLNQSAEYHSKALAIRKGLAPGSLDVAASLNSLGLIESDRGALAKADEYFHEALEIRRKFDPDGLDLARILNNLGKNAWIRGDIQKAERYSLESLSIKAKVVPESPEIANSFNSLGILAEAREDLQKAEYYYRQALQMHQKFGQDTLAAAMVLENLGQLSLKHKNISAAEDYFRQAMKIQENLAPGSLGISMSLSNLAYAAVARKDFSTAEALYRESLGIRERLIPRSKDYAYTLAALGMVSLHENKPEAAERYFDRALSVEEKQIGQLGGRAETRTGFRAKYLWFDQNYIGLLIHEGKLGLAFRVLEHSRARTLLEMLEEAHLDLNNTIDAALLQREESLQKELAAATNHRVHLLSGTHTMDQVDTVDREIQLLLARQSEAQEQMKVNNPSYASLVQEETITLNDVQSKLLDSDTLLLEYSLSEDHSYLLAVSQGSAQAFELPQRNKIEEQAREVYSLLCAESDRLPGETEMQRQGRLRAKNAKYWNSSAALSRMVLQPAADLIRLHKRLLIVPDGALHYIPFAALPVLQRNHSSLERFPLMVDHEVVNLPSMSVLESLRRSGKQRHTLPGMVAVLADPVFSREDPRVQAVSRTVSQEVDEPNPEGNLFDSFQSGEMLRWAQDIGLRSSDRIYFSRLPGSRQEAEVISKMPRSGKNMIALDFDASRDAATGEKLSEYRVVHFATHGLLDSKHPELSGLVLSLVNKEGKPRDGFLGLQDIYNLHLNAGLVVLSACETALGKEIQGEGLTGLTRGFMYAGANRVVASLWNVNDAASAELMARFYKGMFRGGMSPAAALRSSQLQMWKSKDWYMPYYWAAFVIEGEWRPLEQ